MTAVRSLNVLVIDDERELSGSLARTLSDLGHKPITAESAEAGLAALKKRGLEQPDSIDLVLLDVKLPGMTGLQALREIRAFDPSISVLLITAHGNIRDAVEAMREGAYNYIEKPVQETDLQDLIRQAQEARALILASRLSRPKLLVDGPDGKSEFVSSSRQ